MALLMLIDDDHDVLRLNKKYFLNEGYQVLAYENAENALKALEQCKPDCILLDVMMPDTDGFTALPLIRKKSSAPVIFLTGKDSEDDRIHGLLSGAEDYIIKPYSLRELSARIQVQLRKKPSENTAPQSSNGFFYPPLSMDFAKHKVFYNQTTEIELSNREYELLYLLMSHANHLITFEEIGIAIWHVYTDNDRRSVMVIASRLRKHLTEYPGLENIIETAYGKGYQFTPLQKTR